MTNRKAAQKAAFATMEAANAKLTESVAALLTKIMLSKMDTGEKMRAAHTLSDYAQNAMGCRSEIVEAMAHLPATLQPMVQQCKAYAEIAVATWSGFPND